MPGLLTAPGKLPLPHALSTRGSSSLGKRVQRVLLSLPLPQPVRRGIAAVPPRLWLLLLLGLGAWAVFGRSGEVVVVSSEPEEPARVREKDPRLKWLDEHYDAVEAESEGAGQAQRKGKGETPSLPSAMEHVFGSDGLVRVGLDAFEHPVKEIVDRAEGAWDKERGRAVLDMTEWEEEYADANYGRSAPDAYHIWPLGHRRPPPLPSPFLLIFSALPHTAFLRFQQELEHQQGMFTLVVARGRASVELDPKAGKEVGERARGVREIVDRFARDLPDLRVAVSVTPRPRQALRVTTIDVLSAAHSSSAPLSATYNDILLIPSLPSTASSTCPPPAPGTLSAAPTPGLTFLYWPREGLDPCRHSYLKDVAPAWFDEGLLGWAAPVLGFVGGGGATDLVLPVPWPVGEVRHDRDKGEWRVGDVPWEQRVGKLFWRGPTPKGDDIHPAQRLLHPSKRPPRTLLPRGRGFVLEDNPRPLQGLLDISFTPASSSSSDDDSLSSSDATAAAAAAASAASEQAKYKWLLDLSVEGEEHRFPEMLLSGGLVFRAGVFRTWATEQARAWVHYVPVLPDMSDLPALLHYFHTHDQEAQKIAEAGRRWAEDRQRQEDVEGAWFTTLVEYGRMYSRETEEERYGY
ncbi:glycosyltransferase family 90 protein [Calocera viscosa TUFC12733]|uniref:Glycosyltransferase family 90 protein n=1 Tax=Calocera viscosa (strain TUFC12733) TaxID=1330018 RepID=A0A167RSM8_CALVF|nr:glycosyltransferase family 90 protein [Calocera viscosa TUFC12733]